MPSLLFLFGSIVWTFRYFVGILWVLPKKTARKNRRARGSVLLNCTYGTVYSKNCDTLSKTLADRGGVLKFWNSKMQSKMTEALSAVLPVVVIVLCLCFTIAPVSPGILLSFLMGSVLVMVGMMLFTLGAEISMTPMGEKVGDKMTQTKKVSIIVLLSFLPLAFSLVFGSFPVFLITSILSAALDLVFVALQRCNRPRLMRLIQKQLLTTRRDPA